jgi:pullulanase/glycogen debranching enzyme
LNWQNADQVLLKFTQKLIQLRRQHPVFRRCTWFRGQPVKGGEIEDMAWFKFDGEHMKEEDWLQTIVFISYSTHIMDILIINCHRKNTLKIGH